MVRAILEGRKTQTRRPIKPQPVYDFKCLKSGLGYPASEGNLYAGFYRDGSSGMYVKCPFGHLGDRLWVRETWASIWTDHEPDYENGQTIRDVPHKLEYRSDSGAKFPGDWPDDAGDDEECAKWKPSIHMPRWASRITLEITNVRVERLKSMSMWDSIAEGFPNKTIALGQQNIEGRRWFSDVWGAIYGPGAWDKNPWVWVIEFKKI